MNMTGTDLIAYDDMVARLHRNGIEDVTTASYQA